MSNFENSFDLGDVGKFVLFVLAYAILLGFAAGLLQTVYLVLTLPLRRNERVRLFLDLLELGLKEGRAPESAIVDAATSRDESLGFGFQLLAAQMKNGTKLSDALAKAPRVIPPQITGMLKAGERIGDVRKVLPACRQLLRDGVSQVNGALNYVIVVLFVVTPFSIFIPIVLNIYVIPKYKEVFSGMMGGGLPEFTTSILAVGPAFATIQIATFCVMWLIVIGYARNQGSARIFPAIHNWLSLRLPWRRKRLQRDFSSILAVLLDSGMPEADAVQLAAESTANRHFIRRVEKIRAALSHGVPLQSAIADLDDSGELQWRLRNALKRGRDFLRALAGWHEALDAKAFQLEQSAAQLATTGLVLFNGLIVACIVIAIFMALISLVNNAALW
jgi:type II secretory pathway component PulF